MSGGSYFVDHKRGEVNELRALLRNPRIQRDNKKQREVIKKVIAYMTLGIDVSRLCSDMIMASNTKDLVLKKMVYLYLCTYAEQQSDLAIMAINTLHKDVRDQDPMVRGLALRSLCSLRLPNIVEYTMQPIRQRLNDQSAYVRRTAVMGCAKLAARHPDAIKQSDLVDVLYNMLRDKSPEVVTNVIHALNDILVDEGSMAINQQIVLHLLNRLHEFSEWGQCTVLDLVARYQPAGEQEMFDIMNLLEPRLRHSNSAVVLGVTKVFLHITETAPDVHEQVYERLCTPLLTLMTAGTAELTYTVLSHIVVLVKRAPHVFAESYKHFYSRFNDIQYVKLMKLDVLQMIADENNAADVMQELGEYVTDVDAEIARKSIRAIAMISLKLPMVIDVAVESLLSFLNLRTDYVTAETCIVMKDVLRKYPERYEDVIPSLQKCLSSIDEEDGKIAVIWMIGEYGDTIRDAPYILEPLIDAFEEEPSHLVRMELLTAAMKLFFKRPPELKAMLGRLLAAAIEDTSQVDVRDRALLYYRLLHYDVHEAARVVNCPKVIVDTFKEQEDMEVDDQIFREFNSLSVIYAMPATRFVTGVDMSAFDDDDEDEVEDAEGAAADSGAATQPAAAAAAAASVTSSEGHAAPADEMDFFDFDDGSAGGAAAAQDASLAVQLAPNPQVDAATFQNLWGRLPVAHQTNTTLNDMKSGDMATAMESALSAQHVVTMASGTVQDMVKMYLYARDGGNDEIYLVEALLNLNSGEFSMTIKTENVVGAPGLGRLIEDVAFGV